MSGIVLPDAINAQFAVTFQAHVNVEHADIRYHCEHGDGRHSIAITNQTGTVYLCGTFAELDDFASDLFSILTVARDADAITTAEGNA